MSNETTIDQTALALIEEVRRRKAEIEGLQKPTWLTNCAFSYNGDFTPGNNVVNIRALNNVPELLQITGFLILREGAYQEAKKQLDATAEDFTWGGFPLSDWLSDLKTRVSQIQIGVKKAQLARLEDRLDKLISPELRRQLELEAIKKELNI